VLGELYEAALAGRAHPQVEHADGRLTPLRAGDWVRAELDGDRSVISRCTGPTLDVGSGPGRLTVALAERGIPALGIDITPGAVRLARSGGALALSRDVFGHVPGAGRWTRVLLADGNIGIGGDPAALLRRAGELLLPGGLAVVELSPPGTATRRERVRLRYRDRLGDWFPWASVSADRIGEFAGAAGLAVTERWTSAGRWFTALARPRTGQLAAPQEPGRRP
jgi:SAM-dependent methyltransferase